MSKEHKLQSQIAISFSQNRPNEKGLLFSVRNITLSPQDGQKQKAMGMIAGVSDFIYFREESFVGMEIKFPNEKHDRRQIELQYEWGKKIVENGGFYFILTTLEGFWSVIDGNTLCKGVYSLEQIKEKLDGGKSKIVFE